MKLLDTIVNGARILGDKVSYASPDILMVVGIGCLIGAGVKAACDTKNAMDILDEATDEIAKINENHTEEEMQLPAVKKEVRQVKIKTAGKLAWNYKYSIGLAVLGASCVGYGHHMVKAKWVGAAAAYNGLQASYDAAMDRAREKYGDAAVKYIKYGIQEEIVEKEVEDPETGEKKIVNEVVDRVDERVGFPKDCMVFTPNSLLYRECQGSLVYMRSQAEVYQDQLNRNYNQGLVITRNDIVKWLFGMDSPYFDDAGQILGYCKRDPENRKNNAKDCVDLGIFTFLGVDPETGEEQMYLAIDPNIPGVVSFDKSKRRKEWFEKELPPMEGVRNTVVSTT